MNCPNNNYRPRNCCGGNCESYGTYGATGTDGAGRTRRSKR